MPGSLPVVVTQQPGSVGGRQVIEMGLSAAQMVASAKGHIENLTPDQVLAALRDEAAAMIDIREEAERRSTGVLAGAHHVPRGMLEFHADPTSPWHDAVFDPEARIILVSAGGGRSALAVETLQRMGFRRVAHLDGGIKAWIDQGLPVERLGE